MSDDEAAGEVLHERRHGPWSAILQLDDVGVVRIGDVLQLSGGLGSVYARVTGIRGTLVTLVTLRWWERLWLAVAHRVAWAWLVVRHGRKGLT